MRYRFMKISSILLPACMLSIGCASKPLSPPGRNDVVHELTHNDLADESFPYPSDISAIKVPILRAPDLEAKYGKPTYSVMSDGSYVATHLWDSKYLQIVGTPRPPVTFGYKPGGTFRLFGKSVGYYPTGNEETEYRSHLTSFTAPDGRTANYSIVYGGPGTSPQELGRTVAFGW